VVTDRSQLILYSKYALVRYSQANHGLKDRQYDGMNTLEMIWYKVRTQKRSL